MTPVAEQIAAAYAAVIGDLERRAADAFAEGARLEAAIDALRALNGPAHAPATTRPALPAPERIVEPAVEAPAAPAAVAVPRPSNARKFTDDQLRAAVAEGLTLEQMARRFGCTKVAVSVRKRKLGLTYAAMTQTSAPAPVAPPPAPVEDVAPERPAWFDQALNDALPVLRQRALSLTRGNAAEAQDVLQDATMKAIRSWHTFEPGTNFAGWMFTILRNTFLTGKRAQQRETETLDGVDVPVSGGQEAAVELGETLRAVDALPEEQRDAVVSAALGLTKEESAARADVPIGTIGSRVHRGRAELLRVASADSDREEIERFIREKGVTKCPPSSTMRGAQIAAAVEEMGRRKAPFGARGGRAGDA